MRRFDYVMYITPADPKQQRRKTEGRIRSEATTIRGIAAALLGQDHPAIAQLPDRHLTENVTENRIVFDLLTAERESALVEIHEVAEGPVHPVTREGFAAWAERQARENPEVNGTPNTVEQELAAALHQVQLERLYDHKTSELLYIISDLLLDGHLGYSQMAREELLNEIDRDIIQQLDGDDQLAG